MGACYVKHTDTAPKLAAQTLVTWSWQIDPRHHSQGSLSFNNVNVNFQN